MTRTMMQRQIQALSQDLAEISHGLEEEEREAQRVAKENVERHEQGQPLAGYAATPLGAIKQDLEFVEERLASTIKALGVSQTIGKAIF